MFRGLGQWQRILLMSKSKKMHVGAGLTSYGDALSTAAIWGSDSGLVFLLHNQFAVWIPLHTTRNTYPLVA